MEVKKGYKQTELGLIPADWHFKKFEDVMTGFSSGQTPSRAKPEYYKGQIRWITSGELNYNIITDTAEKITQEAVDNTHLKIIPKGTLLIAITGLEAAGTRGSCGIVGEESTTNQSCMALYPTKELITEYLFHFYVRYGNQLAFKYCQGTKQQSYTGKIARILPIALPPTTKEQSAIAAVLSETDILITNLEKLIAKKEAIKKGTMQALLTGKNRLPGFNKERFKVELKDIVNIFKGSGLSKSKVSEAGTFKCILYGELFTKYGQVIRKVVGYTDYTEGIASKNGDILLPGSTTTVGIDLAIASAICENNVLLGGDINILRRKSECYNSEFLAYYLTHIKRNEIAEKTQGTTIIHLYGKSLANIQLDLPMFEEQEAIAKVIEDMEAEVFHLQEKLQKYKMIKQSMMQNLLTGKIRLV